jgi:hypothetical protein
MDYRLLIDLEAVELIQQMPKRSRDKLLIHLQHIREFPTRYADYHERDAQGRRVEISIHGRLAVHYWVDFADRHIKILALKPADA